MSKSKEEKKAEEVLSALLSKAKSLKITKVEIAKRLGVPYSSMQGWIFQGYHFSAHIYIKMLDVHDDLTALELKKMMQATPDGFFTPRNGEYVYMISDVTGTVFLLDYEKKTVDKACLFDQNMIVMQIIRKLNKEKNSSSFRIELKKKEGKENDE